MTINAEQIRAARACLKWTQGELAERAGVNINSIKNIEAETTQARSKMLANLRHVFEMSGLEFLPNSGVRVADDLIRIIDGTIPWLVILDDIFKTFKDTGGTVYLNGADDRRSPPEVIQYDKKLREHNIQMLHLIEHGNTYIQGRLDEYRWFPKEYMSKDVIAIYAGKVSFSLHKTDWPKHQPDKILLVNNQLIYEDYKKKFEYIWNTLPQPTHSTAPDHERY